MAIITNKNTTQTPLTALGLTGKQSIKWIPAPRVYVQALSTTGTITPPQLKSNGALPVGWTDLGVINGAAKLTYTQKPATVDTGIDKVMRGAYVSERTAQLDFSLSQLDDLVFEQISGLTATSISDTGTPPKVIAATYFLGQEDLNQLQILLVSQNKFDGKEWQYFNPNAYINFAYADTNAETDLKVTAYLPFFSATGQTTESNLAATIFA